MRARRRRRCGDDRATRRGEPGVIGIALPGKRDGDARIRLEIETDEAAANGLGELARRFFGRASDMNHRNAMHRQNRRIGEVNRLAAHLDRELRGADDGRADALAGIDQRQVAAPAQLVSQRAREL